MGVTLGTATVSYIKTRFRKRIFTKQTKLLLLFFGLIFVILQLPSIAFNPGLEAYQAIISNVGIKSRNGSPTGTLRQVRLRYTNFFSKLITGKVVKFEEVNSSALPAGTIENASRWNFWPWLAEKRLNKNLTILLKAVWIMIVLASIICWVYPFGMMLYKK